MTAVETLRSGTSTAFIHPMARVDETVTIGDGAKIWQFASVVRGSVIGEKSSISPGACVDGSTVGARSSISFNVVMGGGFIIGDDVFVGPNVVLCNDMWPRATKDHFDNLGPSVVVRDGASIGANCTILPGLIIGLNAMVAAGSVVGINVPNNHIFLRDGRVVEIEGENRRLYERSRKVPESYAEHLYATMVSE